MLDHKELRNGTYKPLTETHENRLADSIDKLGEKIDSFLVYSTNSMPNRVVYLIFVLIFGLIFGIEGLQFVFKSWLPKVMLQ